MNDDRLRIGDAERAAAAADLGEHFAQGRLTPDEHEERLTAIWSARTAADVAPVFRDLPAPNTAAPPGASYSAARPVESGARSGLRSLRRRLPIPVVVVLAVLATVVVLTHLPIILIGLLALWLVAHHHRGGSRQRRRSWRY